VTSPIDFVRHLELEGERFAHIVEETDPATPVPTCPGWTIADLCDHVTRIHVRHVAMVEDGVASAEELPTFVPSTDHADRVSRFRGGLTALADALRATDPATEVWTWHPEGRSVEWVRRRQAHEMVIHRIDAEYAVGRPSGIEPETFAADGVDEVLRLYVSRMPSWGSFDPDGTTAVIATADGPRRWGVAFGRFHGTTRSGRTVEEEACTVGIDAVRPDAVISGTASDLDRWIWGRGSIDVLGVEGDRSVADRLRALASEKT
jgi:uncharacterized protein (TIGR03083 family)